MQFISLYTPIYNPLTEEMHDVFQIDGDGAMVFSLGESLTDPHTGTKCRWLSFTDNCDDIAIRVDDDNIASYSWRY